MNKYLIIALTLIPLSVFAQIGGNSSYSFLRMDAPARVLALGSEQLSINDNDIAVAINNPSLLNMEMNNKMLVTAAYLFAGTSYQSVAYAKNFEKSGNFIGSIKNMNYGKIDVTNEGGEKLGTAYANDMALQLGWGKAIDSNFSIGANGKMVMSFIDDYFSCGLAVDIAASYYNSTKSFSSTLFLKNIGTQIITYDDGAEYIPFEIAIALSQKLKHAPFRFSVVLQHLEKWNLAYDDPVRNAENTDLITGEINSPSGIEKFADNAMRHIVVGVEFLPVKTFALQLGYNYNRQKNMKIDTKTGMVGFSFGAGLKLTKFQLNYSRCSFSQAGGTNYLSLIVNMNEFH